MQHEITAVLQRSLSQLTRVPLGVPHVYVRCVQQDQEEGRVAQPMQKEHPKQRLRTLAPSPPGAQAGVVGAAAARRPWYLCSAWRRDITAGALIWLGSGALGAWVLWKLSRNTLK